MQSLLQLQYMRSVAFDVQTKPFWNNSIWQVTTATCETVTACSLRMRQHDLNHSTIRRETSVAAQCHKSHCTCVALTPCFPSIHFVFRTVTWLVCHMILCHGWSPHMTTSHFLHYLPCSPIRYARTISCLNISSVRRPYIFAGLKLANTELFFLN